MRKKLFRAKVEKQNKIIRKLKNGESGGGRTFQIKYN